MKLTIPLYDHSTMLVLALIEVPDWLPGNETTKQNWSMAVDVRKRRPLPMDFPFADRPDAVEAISYDRQVAYLRFEECRSPGGARWWIALTADLQTAAMLWSDQDFLKSLTETLKGSR